MVEKKSKFSGITSQIGLQPKEATLEVKRKNSKLFIGIPKENLFQENRIPLTPNAVAVLTSNGHRVVIESKAGEGAHFTDAEYTEAGGEIVFDKKKVYQANILMKISPFVDKEIELLHPNQIIISAIHIPTLKEKTLNSLMDKKVTSIALEYLKEDNGTFPIVRAMSEIAGSTSILVAAEYLNNINHGKGILLGGISGIPPTKVVIIGAGVVGEFATRTALGLGAEVKVFDNNMYKLMRLQNHVGRRVFSSIINSDILSRELQYANVAIGALHAPAGRTPVVVTDKMVSDMKPGSIIVDVSIDQGGCFETSETTSHDKPTYKKHDVIHYCVPNIASRVSRTASHTISTILLDMLKKVSTLGGFEQLLLTSSSARHGVYLYKGSLTNEHIGQRFNIKYTDLGLLFAANI